MSQTLKVIYDGQVFRPETPPDLKPNTVCEITIDKTTPPANYSGVSGAEPRLPNDAAANSGGTLWDYLREVAGTIEGSEGLSTTLNHEDEETSARGTLEEIHPQVQGDTDQTGPEGKSQLPIEKRDAWDILEGMIGTVDAPADWSEEHDHYIHGAPKRNRGDAP